MTEKLHKLYIIFVLFIIGWLGFAMFSIGVSSFWEALQVIVGLLLGGVFLLSLWSVYEPTFRRWESKD